MANVWLLLSELRAELNCGINATIFWILLNNGGLILATNFGGLKLILSFLEWKS